MCDTIAQADAKMGPRVRMVVASRGTVRTSMNARYGSVNPDSRGGSPDGLISSTTAASDAYYDRVQDPARPLERGGSEGGEKSFRSRCFRLSEPDFRFVLKVGLKVDGKGGFNTQS